MKYLLLISRAEDVLPEPGSKEAAAMAAAFGKVMAEMGQKGVLIDSGPLLPSSASTFIREQDGGIVISDIPAAEIKEYLGGYTLIECADLDEAITWASKLPGAGAASVEIRPVGGTAG
jgi:hypothetical protein